MHASALVVIRFQDESIIKGIDLSLTDLDWLAHDKITVKFLPAKDGSPLGFLKTVIMPDGRVIQISAGNPND